MKKYAFLLLPIFMALTIAGAQAQHHRPDAELQNLKGPVKTVGTFIRGPHNRVIGQPAMLLFRNDGYLDVAFFCDTNGTAIFKVKYEYDKQKHLVHDQRINNANGDILVETDYIYDKKNRTITAAIKPVNDTVSDYTVYTFDKNNNVTRIANLDENHQVLSALTSVYDDNDKIITTTHTEGAVDQYINHDNFRYDNEGNVIMQTRFNLNRVAQQLFYVYTFDAMGNWIERRTFYVQGNEAFVREIATREITYYE